MTSLNRGDKDLHNEDDTHRFTPASASGHVLEQHQRRIREHLLEHAEYVESLEAEDDG